jgi:hypothetical protein
LQAPDHRRCRAAQLDGDQHDRAAACESAHASAATLRQRWRNAAVLRHLPMVQAQRVVQTAPMNSTASQNF